ncbi:MAG: hypothetical protein AB8E15_09505 [Bdellovibrionales bacterium]
MRIWPLNIVIVLLVACGGGSDVEDGVNSFDNSEFTGEYQHQDSYSTWSLKINRNTIGIERSCLFDRGNVLRQTSTTVSAIYSQPDVSLLEIQITKTSEYQSSDEFYECSIPSVYEGEVYLLDQVNSNKYVLKRDTGEVFKSFEKL